MIFVWILLVLIALTLGLCWYIYRTVFYSPKKGQNDDRNLMQTSQLDPYREACLENIDALRNVPYEPVRIRSFDGLWLRGRYYHHADEAPLAICFHGYRGTPVRDFSGGAFVYMERGMNLLMVEERAHGKSQGHTTTLGILEKKDVVSWAAFGRKRLGDEVPVLLCGISMGAAAVIMASALELPENVKGIVADCPYTSPREILETVGERHFKLPAKVIYPLVWLAARVFGGFDLKDGGAVQAVKSAKVPILLIHGEEDRLVPCEMGVKIAEANPEAVRLEIFPEAGHGMSFLADKDRYESLVGEFIGSIL